MKLKLNTLYKMTHFLAVNFIHRLTGGYLTGEL